MIAEHTLDKSFPAASHKWLDRLFAYAVAVFFFLLPLQTRYIFITPTEGGVPYEYGTLSLFLVEMLGWVLILTGAVKIKNQKSKIKNVWLLGLPMLAFLSILWAPDKAVALQAAVRLFEGVLLFFVIRHALYVTHYTLIWAFIAGAVLQAGLGLYQFLTQSSFASTILGTALHSSRALGTAVVEFGDERWLRAYGGLPHPNVLGGYLVLALLISYQRLQTVVSGYKRLLLQGAILVLLTGLFFTFSRSAWLAGVILLVYWFVSLFFSERKLYDTQNPTIVGFCVRTRLVWLTVGYLAFLFILYRPLVAARIFSDAENRLEVKSRVERVEGAREAWKLIRQNPLLGVGIGNYTQAVAREVRTDDPLYTYQPVHNVLLIVLAELGFVGLALFIAVLYFIFKQSSALMFLCFLVLIMFDHYLWTLPFGILLFWPVLGLSTIYAKRGT